MSTPVDKTRKFTVQVRPDETVSITRHTGGERGRDNTTVPLAGITDVLAALDALLDEDRVISDRMPEAEQALTAAQDAHDAAQRALQYAQDAARAAGEAVVASQRAIDAARSATAAR